MARSAWIRLSIVWVGLGLGGCATSTAPQSEPERAVAPPAVVETAVAPPIEVGPTKALPRPGERLDRSGDEIMVAGQLFHTGTPVVLWVDAGGYDGYRVERRFANWARADWDDSKLDNAALATPNRYGMRAAVLKPDEIERVRGGGWDLPLLQRVVDQFVLHYDAAGTSRRCFERLHDDRGLSIHFMLDVDGTIYQTLDLKERAWHATIANSRSIGIEIANIGAYPNADAKPLTTWYRTDAEGRTEMTIPAEGHPKSIRGGEATMRPIRDGLVAGEIRGETLYQYDLTEAQYAALGKLTAALCSIFPRLNADYPRDEKGELLSKTMSEEQWRAYGGLIGHYHIQTNKVDPGPALQWERIIKAARTLMRKEDAESPVVP